MKRGQVELKRVPIVRRTRLRHRSKKMEAIYEERRPLVERLLKERPVCEVADCARQSVDVHEVHTRGRGGSILDEANCMTVCRRCHRQITDNPAWAHENGYVIHSWEADKSGDKPTPNIDAED